MLKRLSFLLLLILLFLTTSAFAAGVIQLPRTGQTKCYSGDPFGEEIPCTGTGQDGEIQAGVEWPEPRFTPGTGAESDCVTDNLTGLMWSKRGSLQSGKTEWYYAIDYANNLTLCGYSDWRLPNANELGSLVNAGLSNTATWLNSSGFTNVLSDYYWSSTAYSSTWFYVYIIHMTNGDMYYKDDRYQYYNHVWPVRSGQSGGLISLPKTGKTDSYRTGDDGDLEMGVECPNPRFTLGTGTESDCFTDNLTGLMWVATPDSIQKYWRNALDYSNGLSVCGYSDWRLPNRNELYSLGKYNPTFTYPPLKSGFYWSSTNYMYGAWIVDIWGGSVISFDKGNYGYYVDYVLPVRSGQVGGPFDYYCNSDSDGYISTTVSDTCTGNGCMPPSGCQTIPGDDCNDNDASVNPGAAEVCDAVDNNCDGEIDEGLTTRPTTCGVGLCASTGYEICTAGSWSNNTCMPLNFGTEGPYYDSTCSDSIDNDCDGKIDIADISCNITLPQTGQTKCYNSEGSMIPCVDTGQDGEIRAGETWPYPRFTIGTGVEADCVTDNLTGLMWPENGNLYGTRTSWNSAIDYANNLTLCGYSDWHLPNVNELESLATAARFSNDFTNVQSDFYWSSTTPAYYTNYAWLVHMTDVLWDVNKGYNFGYVWPVRSVQLGGLFSYSAIWKTGQTVSYRQGDDGDLEMGVAWPYPRFSDNAYWNETVTDNLTGLVWLKDANCIKSKYPGFDNDSLYGDGKVTWEHAFDFIKGINNGAYINCGAGYQDWRLPNRNELMSLLDYSRLRPALPSGYLFTNLPSDNYGPYDYPWESSHWSSTTAYTYSDDAFIVGLMDVAVLDQDKKGAHYVWPVRSGQVDGLFDFYCDSDNDGYFTATMSGSCRGNNCIPTGCQITAGDDCNDSNNTVYSGATELCDSADNNCNYQIDEGVQNTYYKDADSDGYGNPSIINEGCTIPTGYVINNTDCNDNSAAMNPGATDANCNGIDENCSGTADDEYVPTPTTCGVGECVSSGQLICKNGSTIDTCTPGTPGTEGPFGNETCNDGDDNDCNGFTDGNDANCKAPVSDLTVTSVSNPPISRKRGSSFNVTAKMKNKGIGAVDKEFTIGYYLSKNRDKRINKEADIMLTDNAIMSSLVAGASSTKKKIPVNIGTDTPIGKYYVKVCTDNRNDIAETNEDNNCRASVGKIKIK